MSVIYITGGARSGKSTLAEKKAGAFRQVLYIATARVLDEEMEERVRIHAQRRDPSWRTHEGYRDLTEAIRGFTGCILLDCVTNLLTNMMLDIEEDWDAPTEEEISRAEEAARGEIEGLIYSARAQGNELILVSNELGMGLVPVYPFGRVFRDIAGRLNQHIASLSDEAYLCVSGIPLRIK